MRVKMNEFMAEVKRNNYTQQELAAEMGFTYNTLRRRLLNPEKITLEEKELFKEKLQLTEQRFRDIFSSK